MWQACWMMQRNKVNKGVAYFGITEKSHFSHSQGLFVHCLGCFVCLFVCLLACLLACLLVCLFVCSSFFLYFFFDNSFDSLFLLLSIISIFLPSFFRSVFAYCFLVPEFPSSLCLQGASNRLSRHARRSHFCLTSRYHTLNVSTQPCSRFSACKPTLQIHRSFRDRIQDLVSASVNLQKIARERVSSAFGFEDLRQSTPSLAEWPSPIAWTG